eukprot:gene10561-11702_t
MEQKDEEVVVHVSSEAKLHRYDPDSDTAVVKEELLRFYGLGELRNRKNGRGVGTLKIKAGIYDYYIAPEQPRHQQT